MTLPDNISEAFIIVSLGVMELGEDLEELTETIEEEEEENDHR